MFVVKPLCSRYLGSFWSLLLLLKWHRGYIDTLLSFQIFFISRAKFSYFENISASILGSSGSRELLAICITRAVLFCLSKNTVSGLLKSTILSLMIALSQYKIVSADSSSGSGLYLQYSGVVLSSSLYFVALYWWIIFASWLCLLRYVDSYSDEHPAITRSVVLPTLSHFLHLLIASAP